MGVTQQEFQQAQKDVHTAKSSTNEQLLALYAHYKQATEGDVRGKQPSRMKFRDRAKWDTWNKIKGMDKQTAMDKYVAVVKTMLGRAKL